MALRIFETDPDAKPRERVSFEDGTVGKAHSGKQVPGKGGQMVPVALDHWEFSTGDADVANGLSELFHAPVIDTQSDAENFLRIEDTGTDRVEVVIESLTSDMKQWAAGKLVHHCDGVAHLSVPEGFPGAVGGPCGCPLFFKERKEASKIGRGPRPAIKLVFRLADAPDLGTFAFSSTSWDLAAALPEYEDKLNRAGKNAVAELALEYVTFTIKKGKNAGLNVEYYKPVLDNIRSYDDANAE